MRPTLSLSENAEAKLRNIMEIRGLASLEAAAEFAFKESERKALILKKLYADPLPDEAWADAFYPEYDLEKIRAMDMPQAFRDDAAWFQCVHPMGAAKAKPHFDFETLFAKRGFDDLRSRTSGNSSWNQILGEQARIAHDFQ